MITKSGKAYVAGDMIISLNGEAVAIPSYETLLGSFTFTESNFKNAIFSATEFSASVVSLSELIGSESKGEFAKITVKYDLTKISSIELQFIEDGASVKVNYEFL